MQVGDALVAVYIAEARALSQALVEVGDDCSAALNIGKTIKDVEDRVAYQCKGSASFDNPVILGRWQVRRVSSVETAVHATLKSKGKWRENVPGTEWFNTTINEIETIVNFIRS